MPAKAVALAVRFGIAAINDTRTRTALAAILCAIFMPLILIIVAILCMADGAAEHNRATVQAAFDTNIILTSTMPDAYRSHIAQMRQCFAALEAATAALDIPEDASALDITRMKAIYYGIYYDQENLTLSAEDARAFVECFITYEERQREVEQPGSESTKESEEENESVGGKSDESTMETYIVAIPLTDLTEIFENVSQHTGHAITLEQQSACLEVYYMIQYGDVSRAASADELEAILVNADTEYAGGIAGSPFSDDWRSHVTSEFADRSNPLTGAAELHRGIDLAAPKGTAIHAVASGTVILARYNHPSYGNYIVIDHGGGTTTLYAHCDTLTAATGQPVGAGDVIATVGSTGDATGNHLHLEVKVAGELVNPRNFLQ